MIVYSRDMAEFGNRLKQTREDRDLSQSALAKLVGLQPSAISHFETGRRLPSFDNIVKLVVVLRKSADYLMGIEQYFAVPRTPEARVLKAFDAMAHHDQESFIKFGEMLAKKPNGKRGGK